MIKEVEAKSSADTFEFTDDLSDEALDRASTSVASESLGYAGLSGYGCFAAP